VKLSSKVKTYLSVNSAKDFYDVLPTLSIVSFTGSENIGRIVGKNVASRFGKSILELGGNNGQILFLRDI